jgi:hypothetical protein
MFSTLFIFVRPDRPPDIRTKSYGEEGVTIFKLFVAGGAENKLCMYFNISRKSVRKSKK